MGALRNPTFGILVPETRANPDTLLASGTGNALYTQAGPVPGHPVPEEASSRWRPQVRAAQSASLEAITVRGGYPGRDSGAASIAVRVQGDSDADYQSWDEPNLLTGWTTPDDAWGSSATWSDVAAAVNPTTNRILVVARSSTNTRAWRYDPRTEQWTVVNTLGISLPEPIGLVYDEEAEQFVLFAGAAAGASAGGSKDYIAFSSSNEGDNWDIYSRGMYDSVIDAGGPLKVASAVGLDWLALSYNGAATDQYASSDRGVTWNRVGVSITGTLHHPLRTASGWCVAYARTADSFLCVRLLGSARATFADAAEEALSAFAIQNVVGCRDYDGALYLYATRTNGDTYVYVSYDEGASFAAYVSSGSINELALSSAAVQPTWFSAVPAAGSIYCIGMHEADTQWHACRFGGWSNAEQASRGEVGSLALGPKRFGAGASSVSVEYIALEFPDTYGSWTRGGAAGTRTMSPATGVGFEISCTQAQVEQYTSTATNFQDWAGGAAGHVFVSGNDLGGAAPTFNSGCAWEIVLDNGTNRWTAYIEIGASGIKVHGTAASAAINFTTTNPFHLRWVIRPNAIDVWYRTRGTAKWTRAVSGHALTAAATVADQTYAIFGHAAAATAGTSVLQTHYAYHSGESSFRTGLDTIATSDDDYTAGILGLAYGRRVPGRGSSYPLPMATSTAEDMGFLTAVGGPSHTTEIVALPADHTYGTQHLHPEYSPSPRRVWRSTDTSEVRLVWDQGSDLQAAWYGAALALVALRAVPRTIELGYDDGVGGWTTIGTLDKGWSGINYTRVGSLLIPRTGTATIARYFEEGELVGGYVVLSTAGPSVARRIVRQSAGYWTTAATSQRMRIQLEGVDGSETALGTGELVHHSGILVCYPAAEVSRRYLRIRITASQVTPEGYYEGKLFVARVVGVHPAPSWDWTVMTELSRQTDRGEDGALVVRESGPPRRVLEYGWPDGQHLGQMRLLATDAEYIGVQAGVAIGTRMDAWAEVVALIEHRLRSGEVPAVVVPRLPTTDGTTITDRSQSLYGRVLSDAAGLHGILGREGVNEVVRGDSWAWEELR